jgi:hypothetical protein
MPMFLLLACTGPAPDGSPPLTDVDSAAVPCTSWGYGEPVAVELGVWVPTANAGRDCDEGAPANHLEDVTGDGRADVVITGDCADEAVGRDHWLVLPGIDGGFGPAAIWPLPGGYGATAFEAPRDSAECSGGDDLPAWFSGQLDGDGLPDLVVTESCFDATPASGIWTVYPNTGAGFGSATAREVDTRWSNGTFTHPREVFDCGSGLNIPAWDRLDLDGDGLLDIVLTRSCLDWTIGDTEWEVLHNDGASFTASRWPVVEALAMSTLSRAADTCLDYFLLDVDGDDRPEVIASQNCTDSGSWWYVNANTGAGFSTTRQRLSVPWGLAGVLDAAEQRTAQCGAAKPAWIFGDTDGDGRADLTVTESCTDTSVGDTRWAWWQGGLDGWPLAGTWSLPANWTPGTFVGSSGAETACVGTRDIPRWVRHDLDGDGTIELVITQTCDDMDATRWLIHSPTCLDD